MFDTHCHLNLSEFEKIVPYTIDSARETGVKYFLIPGINIKTSEAAAKITEDFENVYFAAGIHPTEDLDNTDKVKSLYQLEELVTNHPKVAAIGEIGLDYYRFLSGSKTQKSWLEDQIYLARKLKLPVILHNRQATDDLLDVLKISFGHDMSGNVVFHCCPPETRLLEFAIDHNIYIGVDGDVTYDTTKQEFVKKVPIQLLLLETDSPYLTPEPLKSEKVFPNKPENLRLIAKQVALQKNMDLDEVMQMTSQNARDVFTPDTTL